MWFFRFIIEIILIVLLLMFIGILAVHYVATPDTYQHPIFKDQYAKCNFNHPEESFWYRPIYGYIAFDGKRQYIYGHDWQRPITADEFKYVCTDYGVP